MGAYYSLLNLLLWRTNDLSFAQQGNRFAATVLDIHLSHDDTKRAAPPGFLVRLSDFCRDRIGLSGIDFINELDVLPGMQTGQSWGERHRRLHGSSAQAQAKCGWSDHVGIASRARSLGIQV